MLGRLAIVTAIGTLSLTGAVPPSFGHSRTRAQRFNGHGVHVDSATTCTNVEEDWYTGAVVDNYAPVQEQKLWTDNGSRGQRYFSNDQFWGGPGEFLAAPRSISPSCNHAVY